MKKFMLNDLGKDWVWEAKDEKEDTILYIEDVLQKTFIDKEAALKNFKSYCEEIGIDSKLDWKEV